jgi:ATP-dependent protease HslVU (ClpYQ) peptidase subunit
VFRFRDIPYRDRRLRGHNAVLQSYFSRYPDNVKLDTPAEIFETWRQMHRTLREEYHMNPRAETDDAYETTRMSALLASPRGIFGVTPSRDVEAFPRFWAIGSGAAFAVGAMFTLYERSHDAEEIARRCGCGRGIR